MSREDRTVVFQLPTLISGQLACIEGTVAGRSWPLSAGTFVIGRETTADLPLPQEPGVSKVHAKIVAEGDHYTLYDAESRNGTIVNGQPVQRIVLNAGDEIRVCGCVLRFTQEGGNPQSRQAMPSMQALATGAFPGMAMSPGTSQVFAEGPTGAWGGGAAPMAPLPGAPAVAVVPAAATPPPAPTQAAMGFAGYFATGVVASVLLVGGAAGAVYAWVDDPGAGVDGQRVSKQVTPRPARPPEQGPAGAGGPAVEAVEAVAQVAPAPDAGAAVTTSSPMGGAAVVQGDPQRASTDTSDGAEEAATSAWFPVEVSPASPSVLRARGSGKVKSVYVENGSRVEKGKVLADLEEQVESAEIATLKESIGALESVAESQESAREYLGQERAKLRRLMAAQRNSRIVAPESGVLTGFSLQVGDRVRARQVLGKVGGAGVDEVRASVPAAVGAGLKKGGAATLRLSTGKELPAGITRTRRQAEGFEVTLQCDSPEAENAKSVRFP